MSISDKEIVYWITIASFVMPILLSAILIWFFLAYQKKKQQSELAAKDALLREQSLILEKQTAIEHERNRIASEMHDDLGSGLTTIKFLSEKALMQAKDEKEKQEIQKISQHSNDLVTNMGEIIWAMNSRFDDADSLISYVRRYASEYLEEYNIEVQFIDEMENDNLPLSGEKRRNIFLVVKEILHNIVKYSGVTNVNIAFLNDAHFSIYIQEIGGKGFDVKEAKSMGNGLFNMQKRMESIGGQIVIDKRELGMVYTLLS